MRLNQSQVFRIHSDETRGAHRPYGFLERFDPNFTPNTSDLSGKRYTFRNQPEMGQWNLAQLANAFIKGDLLNVVRAHVVPVPSSGRGEP